MPEHADWKQRLDDKRARKALSELYGNEVDAQAERYLRLAEAAAGDQPGAELRFYSASGRTELGGNHTDHNRGRVLCAAVHLDAVACVSATANRIVELRSEGYPDPIRVELSSLKPVPSERGTTAALIRGVAKGIADHTGALPRAFKGRINSEVLGGSGLSSSASIEVLLGTIFADVSGVEIPAVEIAKIGQFAENEYFGKPCGLMDQTASAVGGIVAIDFANPAEPKVKRIAYDFAEVGYELVVVNTGGNHADLTADYAGIPAEMKAAAKALGSTFLRELDPTKIIERGPEIRKACGDRAFLRSLHFAAENERVVGMVEALRADDVNAYLKLVKQSGRSSWELLQNIYAPSEPDDQGISVALALSAEFLRRKGAWRVHGGGFAGTIQAYVPRKLLPGYTSLMERYFGPGSVIPIAIRARGAMRVRV